MAIFNPSKIIKNLAKKAFEKAKSIQQSGLSQKSGGMSVASGSDFSSSPSSGGGSSGGSSGGGSSGGGGGSSGGGRSGGGSSGGAVTSLQDFGNPQLQSQISSKDLTSIEKFEASKSGGGNRQDPLLQFGKDIVRTTKDVYEKGKDFVKPFSEDVKTKFLYQDPTLPDELKKKSLGERADDFLTNIEQEAIEGIFSSKKDERIEAEIVEKTLEDYTQKVENFNKKFGGKELSEDEYNRALEEQRRIESEGKAIENFLSSKERKEQAELFERPFERFIQSAGVGIVSSPFELGKFGVGLATKPVKTIEETGQAFLDIPAQISADPFGTTGELLGNIAGQVAIFGGGIRGGKKLSSKISEVTVVEKPANIIKTPLNKVFAEDMRVFLEGDLVGRKVKIIEPSDLALKRLGEKQRIESALDKSEVGKRISREKKLIEDFELEKTLRDTGLRKGDINIIEKDFITGKSEPIFFDKPSKTQKLALKRIKEKGKIESATDFLLKESDKQKAFNKATEIISQEPRVGALKKFKKRIAKEPKPVKPIEFSLDLEPLRRLRNRLRSGASKRVLDKDLNTRIVDLEPRTKTPRKIKKLKKRAKEPSFEYRYIDEIPDEVKGEVAQRQRSGQQQQLVKQEQIQKQIQKTEPIQEVRILSDKQLSRLRQKQKRLQKQRQKQRQRQLERDDLRTSLMESPRQRVRGAVLKTQKQKVKQKERVAELVGVSQMEKSLEKEMAKTISSPAEAQSPREAIIEKEMQVARTLLTQEQVTRKPRLRFKRKRTQSQTTSKKQGYDVYVKPPKRKKYVKVTKKPVGLQEARDTRNYFLDQTTSRQGYIKPTKKKASPLRYDIPQGYASRTEPKFRTFKQKKGKRTKLQPERVIEKGKHILDTRGERKQLSIFKAMAQAEKKKQSRRSKNKPVGLDFA